MSDFIPSTTNFVERNFMLVKSLLLQRTHLCNRFVICHQWSTRFIVIQYSFLQIWGFLPSSTITTASISIRLLFHLLSFSFLYDQDNGKIHSQLYLKNINQMLSQRIVIRAVVVCFPLNTDLFSFLFTAD